MPLPAKNGLIKIALFPIIADFIPYFVLMMRTLLLSILIAVLFPFRSGAQTGQWQTITSPSAPTARHECSYVQAGNKFYLVGGRGTKPVQAYDPITNTWATETNPPMQMHHFQAVQYGGKIYVAGAFTGNCCHETPVANIYIYDPATKVWTAGPQIPAARRRGAAGCVIQNNKIYLVCGITDGHSSGWVPWLDAFDLQTNTWTQLADAPRPRDHFHATVVNGKIYAIGGRRTGFNGNLFAYTTPEVDVYDIATNTWSTLPAAANIPTQRAACATAILGDEILVIGGESAQVAHAQTEAFHVLNQSWRTLAPMNQSRHATSAVVYNNEVYIACGAGTRGGSQELNSQEKFSLTSSSGCVPNEVVSFTLMRAGTGGEIGPLTDGMTINLATMGAFSIRANKCQNSGSVKFVVNGSTVRTESSAPYSINGDNNGSYVAWNPTTGTKTLVGIPYTQGGGGGTAGISKTVTFTVVNQTNTVDCNGVPGGAAYVNTCGICVGGNTGLNDNAGKDCNGVCNGSAAIDDCGVCSGGNTGHIANSDKDACGVCFGNGSSCGGCQPVQVTQFMLMRTGTAGEIGLLTEGMTVNLATMPPFSLRADVCSTAAVKSVRFILDGTIVRTENIAPYAIHGDTPTGSYNRWNVSTGNHTVSAIPYSGSNGTGTAGIALTRNFTVINGSAKTEQAAESSAHDTPTAFIYPNPFSDAAEIRFSVDVTMRVRAEIISTDGKIIQTLFDGTAEGGLSYTQEFSSASLPDGMYFFRLVTEQGFAVTQKMLLMR